MLLTAADIAARTNYLNARQTLHRLLDWEVVPVVNENDTTATDEINFGDNDFLAAQVALLLGAPAAGPADQDIDGLLDGDPKAQARGAKLILAGRGTRSKLADAGDRRRHLGSSARAGCS